MLTSLLAGVVLSWWKNKCFDELINTNNFSKRQAAKKKSGLASCPRVFEGEAEIRVWQTETDGETVLKIADEDTTLLPQKECDYLNLVDLDPELEAKLSKSSEKNPVKIKITGFAKKCSGNFIASVNYKNGIFKPFL
jgi:hypothetical protein